VTAKRAEEGAGSVTAKRTATSRCCSTFSWSISACALLARALAGSELRADEYAVYSVLFERGALTPTQLAAGLAMPVTTVLDYLRVMTRRGHFGRARNPLDGRSYTVSLTAEGLRAHRSTNALWPA
jgi:DNA-binding MarR family transcriptional regulator